MAKSYRLGTYIAFSVLTLLQNQSVRADDIAYSNIEADKKLVKDRFGNMFFASRNGTTRREDFDGNFYMNGNVIELGSKIITFFGGISYPVEDNFISNFESFGKYDASVVVRKYGTYCEYSLLVSLGKNFFRSSTFNDKQTCDEIRLIKLNTGITLTKKADPIEYWPIEAASSLIKNKEVIDPTISFSKSADILKSFYSLYILAQYCSKPGETNNFQNMMKSRAVEIENLYDAKLPNKTGRIKDNFLRIYKQVATNINQSQQSNEFDPVQLCDQHISKIAGFYNEFYLRYDPDTVVKDEKPW